MDDDNEKSPQARGAKGGAARAAKLTTEEKALIAKKGAAARWNAITKKSKENNALVTARRGNPITPGQGTLDLQIQKQIEIDGVGMGVLSDGTAFLTGRGLARLCGISNARIVEMGQDWSKSPAPAMTAGIRKILAERGLAIDTPYIEVKQRTGVFYAYPDIVSLAVLEYYAFDAPNRSDQAQKNFRLLAGKALHDFIYTQVGYDPDDFVPHHWQQFHDRVSLTYNSVPKGYFIVFKEIADMIVTLGQAGLQIDSSFVPDGSVGGIWANHWRDNDFDSKFGERKRWEHNYPDYFPQAKSNPQPAWCYPEAALPEFRRWMRENYVGGGKFSNYISNKIRQKELPASFAQLVITAYNIDEGADG
jgi:hypothetical protein